MKNDRETNLFSPDGVKKKRVHARACNNCGRILKANTSLCRICGTWSHSKATVAVVGGRAADGTILLSQVVRKPVARLRSTLLDAVVSGTSTDTEDRRGLAQTAVVVIGAKPGTGKSTLCMLVGAEWLEGYSDRKGLYIVAEQGVNEFADTADRLQLRHQDRLVLVPALGDLDLLLKLDEWIKAYRPLFVIIDSIQALLGDDQEAAREFAKLLKIRSERDGYPTFIVSQVTKEGDLAGTMALQHDVDCLLMIDLEGQEAPRPGETDGDKILTISCPGKNRFGPTPRSATLRMHGRGIDLVTEDPRHIRLVEDGFTASPGAEKEEREEEEDDAEE